MASKSNHKGLDCPAPQGAGLGTKHSSSPTQNRPPTLSAQRGFSGSGTRTEGEVFHGFALPALPLPFQQLGMSTGLSMLLPKAHGTLQDLSLAYLSSLTAAFYSLQCSPPASLLLLKPAESLPTHVLHTSRGSSHFLQGSANERPSLTNLFKNMDSPHSLTPYTAAQQLLWFHGVFHSVATVCPSYRVYRWWGPST